jgi:glycosyltransferase involved in cell wall biosynthesis
MPTKTILFLDQYANLSGGQKVLLAVAEAFTRRGYTCSVILPKEGILSEKLKSLGVECLFFPIGYYSITRKNFFDFINYSVRLPLLTCLLFSCIRKKRVSLVYANGARTFIWATAACALTRTPLVWHVHSIFPSPLLNNMLQFFGKNKIVRKIFAVSQAAALPLKELNKKIEIIYNAAPSPELAVNTELLREEYKLLPNAFLVGTVGMLEEWKHQEDLIRAAKIAKETLDDRIHFFLVGDSLYNHSRRQEYKRKLQQLIATMRLENDFIFTGFREDVQQVMSCLDVIVITSAQPDPCPLVSLEAAALGKPIISTRAGGVTEIFVEDKEILFYTAGDVATLARHIISLYKNRDLASSLGQLAREKIGHNHNLQNFLNRIVLNVEREL